jgi:probable phosphoglycerate mutase
MDLYLARHGRSTGNAPGQIIGWADHPLSAEGVRQAEALARRSALLEPMPVWCSDLLRARATAETVVEIWGSGTTRLTRDPRLRELNMGVLEDRPYDEFIADAELASALEHDLLNTRMPGGEALAELAERSVAAFDEILTCGAPAALVVAHDGPLRAIVNHVLAVPPERFFALTFAHGGLSLLRADDGYITVDFLNDTSHLGDLAEASRLAQGAVPPEGEEGSATGVFEQGPGEDV